MGSVGEFYLRWEMDSICDNTLNFAEYKDQCPGENIAPYNIVRL